jgi:hypothetical protein
MDGQDNYFFAENISKPRRTKGVDPNFVTYLSSFVCTEAAIFGACRA